MSPAAFYFVKQHQVNEHKMRYTLFRQSLSGKTFKLQYSTIDIYGHSMQEAIMKLLNAVDKNIIDDGYHSAETYKQIKASGKLFLVFNSIEELEESHPEYFI